MIVDSKLTIEISELTVKQWRKLEAELSFVTDQGDIVQAYKRRITKGDYLLPRGAWYLLPDSIRYKDRRSFPPMPEVNFNVKLNDVKKDPRYAGQREAVEAMLLNEQGLIIRPPGTGKTQIALAFAARAKTRTLVLVHTEDILNQWVEYTQKAIPEIEVGIIRGRTERIGHITIATVQTLVRKDRKPEWWAQFGAVIADEAHHVSAPTWEAVLNTIPARYRFGFTASPTRADGLHPTMKFIVGPIIHRQRFSSPVSLEVIPVKTKFYFPYRGPFDWGNLVRALVSDKARNRRIAKIANREVAKGNSILVLSRRIEHLEKIGELLDHDYEILAAKLRTKAERKDALARFRSGELRCVLATQLADEALDVPRLNRVILAHPGKHEGRIIQQIGRAIRQHPDKQNAKIYDIADVRVRPLKRQWNERKRAYKVARIPIRLKRKVMAWH